MPVIQGIKLVIALVLSLGLGALGLYQMVTAELQTGSEFEFYFKWAFGAGLVFLAVSAALTAYDRDEAIVTPLDDERAKK